MKKRVVITGLGVVSSLGIGKDAFWTNLIKGKSGISKVTLFDTSQYNRHYAGEIKDFVPENFIPKRMVKFLGRASQLAIAGTKLALEDASVEIGDIKEPIQIIVGTTLPEGNVLDFSSRKLLEQEGGKITNQFLLNAFPPAIPRNIGYFFKKEGVNLLIPCACAAGNYAIGYGFDLIRRGETDFAIVGGAEALSRLTFQGFQRLHAMSPKVCSPFDKNRKGMLLGEAAGILILESYERAVKRGAPIYAEVLSYGLSCDASHITIPNQEGIKKTMAKALKNGDIALDEVDYISAHGTGTLANDIAEAGAIKGLFGPRGREIPVSSIKSMLGHCMGAASALEAISCCLSLKEGVIPPTMNFVTPDPECDIDCVPNHAREAKLKTVLNNGFAFGGNNCCVALGKPN